MRVRAVKPSGLAASVGFGVLVVALALQVRPAVGATTGDPSSIDFAVSSGVVSSGQVNAGGVTNYMVVASRGATITMNTDGQGSVTFVNCRVTLSSGERGGIFYDKTTKAPGKSWCPVPTLKVQGSAGEVETVVVQETLDYADPGSGQRTVSYNAGLLQIATAAYVAPTQVPTPTEAPSPIESVIASPTEAPLPTPNPSATPPSGYHPTATVRLVDTRNGNGLTGGLMANTPATFQVTGRGGVPTTATAVTATVTVLNATSAGGIYVGPDPIADPTAALFNFDRNQIAANGETLVLSPSGTLSATYIAAAGTTSLIFDVSGYFTNDGTGATYYPLAQARLLDTRNGIGLTGQMAAATPRTFQVSGQAGVPNNAIAVTGYLTVLNATAAGGLYVGPTPMVSPSSSQINFVAGQPASASQTLALSATGTAMPRTKSQLE
jgi:hypothetical protein